MTDWGEIYAHVCACTGWTWEYIAEHLDLPRLDSLNRYWAQHPPVHMLVAQYMGIKPQPHTQGAQIAHLDDQDAVPVQHMSAPEFDALLRQKGLQT